MKRTLFAALLALPCLALPALAEDAPTAPPKPAHVRVTWQERFTKANATHDGHLTLDQAKAGDAAVFRHFGELDTGGKGFVTLEDIKAWHKQQRAARQAAPPNPLRPHHAFLHTNGAPPAVKASTEEVVPNTTATVGPDGPRAENAPG